MTLATLSRALAGRFQLLTTGARTALPRHQSLHALKRAFRRLGVFSGGWTVESAQAVCADDDIGADELLAILSSLVDKSLVVADPAPAMLRYGMLETTRAYALDRLTLEGERDATAQRHAEYFQDLLRRSSAIPTHRFYMTGRSRCCARYEQRRVRRLARGRPRWSYEESIAAALEFERRSRPSASESYG